MLVPLRWLAEWTALPATDELVDKLTFGGLEVDSVEKTGADLSAMRVGFVLERAQHPNADRLSVCQVDLGDEDPVQIVCGAPNVDVGQKVVVVSPGARLPDGTKIKKSKIRGEVSYGMICSESELGIGDGHDGILVLPDNATIGQPADEVIDSGDTVVEIAILANRGDCTSMLGVAREVQAHFGAPIEMPPTEPDESGSPAAQDIEIHIDDRQGCAQYAARVVRGIRVGPSPEWLQAKLQAAGLRSINNIVDVSNLVMLEFGQPLHAFDLDKMAGGEIRVRSAAPSEILVTLDGEERKLVPEDLVIADANDPVALAGVMGGANSEVSSGTTNLLIESAQFDPSRVRRTAKRHTLHSDASYRFERGVDAAGVTRAADRAARLIAELAGGDVAPGHVLARGEARAFTSEVILEPDRVNRLLGSSLAADQVKDLLARVGVSATLDEGGALRCAIPSHRNDLSIPEDLIEEVARIHGFENIPVRVMNAPLVEGKAPPSWVLSDQVRDALRAEGLSETVNFPFLAASDLDQLRLDEDDPRRKLVRVLNPISEEETWLRSTLVPTLLRVARENLNRQVDHVRCYEVSRVFLAGGGEDGLPGERLWAAGILTRGEQPGLWQAGDAPPLFFDAKGTVQRLLGSLGHDLQITVESDQPFLHPGASCGLVIGKRRVGWMGELHPTVAAAFGVEVPCAIFELDLSALPDCPTREKKFHPVSRHPAVQRDLAVVLDRTCRAGELEEAIRKQAGSHLLSVEVFDRYEGKGVPEGKLSLAFRLVFQRPDRTLTDTEVTKSIDRVVQMLSHRFGGELR